MYPSYVCSLAAVSVLVFASFLSVFCWAVSSFMAESISIGSASIVYEIHNRYLFSELCRTLNWTHSLLHLFMAVLKILYQWNHTECNLSRLTFFIQHNTHEIYLSTGDSLVWLESIPQNRCTKLSHHLPTDSHLGCFFDYCKQSCMNIHL